MHAFQPSLLAMCVDGMPAIAAHIQAFQRLQGNSNTPAADAADDATFTAQQLHLSDFPRALDAVMRCPLVWACFFNTSPSHARPARNGLFSHVLTASLLWLQALPVILPLERADVRCTLTQVVDFCRWVPNAQTDAENAANGALLAQRQTVSDFFLSSPDVWVGVVQRARASFAPMLAATVLQLATASTAPRITETLLAVALGVPQGTTLGDVCDTFLAAAPMAHQRGYGMDGSAVFNTPFGTEAAAAAAAAVPNQAEQDFSAALCALAAFVRLDTSQRLKVTQTSASVFYATMGRFSTTIAECIARCLPHQQEDKEEEDGKTTMVLQLCNLYLEIVFDDPAEIFDVDFPAWELVAVAMDTIAWLPATTTSSSSSSSSTGVAAASATSAARVAALRQRLHFRSQHQQERLAMQILTNNSATLEQPGRAVVVEHAEAAQLLTGGSAVLFGMQAHEMQASHVLCAARLLADALYRLTDALMIAASCNSGGDGQRSPWDSTVSAFRQDTSAVDSSRPPFPAPPPPPSDVVSAATDANLALEILAHLCEVVQQQDAVMTPGMLMKIFQSTPLAAPSAASSSSGGLSPALSATLFPSLLTSMVTLVEGMWAPVFFALPLATACVNWMLHAARHALREMAPMLLSSGVMELLSSTCHGGALEGAAAAAPGATNPATGSWKVCLDRFNAKTLFYALACSLHVALGEHRDSWPVLDAAGRHTLLLATAQHLASSTHPLPALNDLNCMTILHSALWELYRQQLARQQALPASNPPAPPSSLYAAFRQDFQAHCLGVLVSVGEVLQGATPLPAGSEAAAAVAASRSSKPVSPTVASAAEGAESPEHGAGRRAEEGKPAPAVPSPPSGPAHDQPHEDAGIDGIAAAPTQQQQQPEQSKSLVQQQLVRVLSLCVAASVFFTPPRERALPPLQVLAGLIGPCRPNMPPLTDRDLADDSTYFDMTELSNPGVTDAIYTATLLLLRHNMTIANEQLVGAAARRWIFTLDTGRTASRATALPRCTIPGLCAMADYLAEEIRPVLAAHGNRPHPRLLFRRKGALSAIAIILRVGMRDSGRGGCTFAAAVGHADCSALREDLFRCLVFLHVFAAQRTVLAWRGATVPSPPPAHEGSLLRDLMSLHQPGGRFAATADEAALALLAKLLEAVATEARRTAAPAAAAAAASPSLAHALSRADGHALMTVLGVWPPAVDVAPFGSSISASPIGITASCNALPAWCEMLLALPPGVLRRMCTDATAPVALSLHILLQRIVSAFFTHKQFIRCEGEAADWHETAADADVPACIRNIGEYRASRVALRLVAEWLPHLDPSEGGSGAKRGTEDASKEERTPTAKKSSKTKKQSSDEGAADGDDDDAQVDPSTVPSLMLNHHFVLHLTQFITIVALQHKVREKAKEGNNSNSKEAEAASSVQATTTAPGNAPLVADSAKATRENADGASTPFVGAVQCPLCFFYFDEGRIAAHASGCHGALVNVQQPHPVPTTAAKGKAGPPARRPNSKKMAKRTKGMMKRTKGMIFASDDEFTTDDDETDNAASAVPDSQLPFDVVAEAQQVLLGSDAFLSLLNVGHHRQNIRLWFRARQCVAQLLVGTRAAEAKASAAWLSLQLATLLSASAASTADLLQVAHLFFLMGAPRVTSVLRQVPSLVLALFHACAAALEHGTRETVRAPKKRSAASAASTKETPDAIADADDDDDDEEAAARVNPAPVLVAVLACLNGLGLGAIQARNAHSHPLCFVQRNGVDTLEACCLAFELPGADFAGKKARFPSWGSSEPDEDEALQTMDFAAMPDTEAQSIATELRLLQGEGLVAAEGEVVPAAPSIDAPLLGCDVPAAVVDGVARDCCRLLDWTPESLPPSSGKGGGAAMLTALTVTQSQVALSVCMEVQRQAAQMHKAHRAADGSSNAVQNSTKDAEDGDDNSNQAMMVSSSQAANNQDCQVQDLVSVQLALKHPMMPRSTMFSSPVLETAAGQLVASLCLNPDLNAAAKDLYVHRSIAAIVDNILLYEQEHDGTVFVALTPRAVSELMNAMSSSSTPSHEELSPLQQQQQDLNAVEATGASASSSSAQSRLAYFSVAVQFDVFMASLQDLVAAPGQSLEKITAWLTRFAKLIVFTKEDGGVDTKPFPAGAAASSNTKPVPKKGASKKQKDSKKGAKGQAADKQDNDPAATASSAADDLRSQTYVWISPEPATREADIGAQCSAFIANLRQVLCPRYKASTGPAVSEVLGSHIAHHSESFPLLLDVAFKAEQTRCAQEEEGPTTAAAAAASGATGNARLATLLYYPNGAFGLGLYEVKVILRMAFCPVAPTAVASARARLDAGAGEGGPSTQPVRLRDVFSGVAALNLLRRGTGGHRFLCAAVLRLPPVVAELETFLDAFLPLAAHPNLQRDGIEKVPDGDMMLDERCCNEDVIKGVLALMFLASRSPNQLSCYRHPEVKMLLKLQLKETGEGAGDDYSDYDEDDEDDEDGTSSDSASEAFLGRDDSSDGDNRETFVRRGTSYREEVQQLNTAARQYGLVTTLPASTVALRPTPVAPLSWPLAQTDRSSSSSLPPWRNLQAPPFIAQDYRFLLFLPPSYINGPSVQSTALASKMLRYAMMLLHNTKTDRFVLNVATSIARRTFSQCADYLHEMLAFCECRPPQWWHRVATIIVSLLNGPFRTDCYSVFSFPRAFKSGDSAATVLAAMLSDGSIPWDDVARCPREAKLILVLERVVAQVLRSTNAVTILQLDSFLELLSPPEEDDEDSDEEGDDDDDNDGEEGDGADTPDYVTTDSNNSNDGGAGAPAGRPQRQHSSSSRNNTRFVPGHRSTPSTTAPPQQPDAAAAPAADEDPPADDEAPHTPVAVLPARFVEALPFLNPPGALGVWQHTYRTVDYHAKYVCEECESSCRGYRFYYAGKDGVEQDICPSCATERATDDVRLIPARAERLLFRQQLFVGLLLQRGEVLFQRLFELLSHPLCIPVYHKQVEGLLKRVLGPGMPPAPPSFVQTLRAVALASLRRIAHTVEQAALHMAHSFQQAVEAHAHGGGGVQWLREHPRAVAQLLHHGDPAKHGSQDYGYILLPFLKQHGWVRSSAKETTPPTDNDAGDDEELQQPDEIVTAVASLWTWLDTWFTTANVILQAGAVMDVKALQQHMTLRDTLPLVLDAVLSFQEEEAQAATPSTTQSPTTPKTGTPVNSGAPFGGLAASRSFAMTRSDTEILTQVVDNKSAISEAASAAAIAAGGGSRDATAAAGLGGGGGAEDSAVLALLAPHRLPLSLVFLTVPDISEFHNKAINQFFLSPKFADYSLRFEAHRSRCNAMLDEAFDADVTVSRDDLLKTTFSAFFDLLNDDDLFAEVARDGVTVQATVSFDGEMGVDAGGPKREFIMLFLQEVAKAGLFTQVPETATYEINPNPASLPPPGVQTPAFMTLADLYRVVGFVMGVALTNEIPVELHLARSIYRHLIGLEPCFSDLEQLDATLFKSLTEVSRMQTDEEFDALFQAFTVTVGADEQATTGHAAPPAKSMLDAVIQATRPRADSEEVELIPGGTHVMVSNANKKDYIKRRSHFRMTGRVSLQLTAFLEGFYRAHQRAYLKAFTAGELEVVLCGLPSIDIEDMRAHTRYEACDAATPQVRWFWEFVAALSQQDLASLLQFSTGCSKVPAGGFANMRNPFTLKLVEGPEDRLPVAHTCYAVIDLPRYTAGGALTAKFRTALELGMVGFDLA